MNRKAAQRAILLIPIISFIIFGVSIQALAQDESDRSKAEAAQSASLSTLDTIDSQALIRKEVDSPVPSGKKSFSRKKLRAVAGNDSSVAARESKSESPRPVTIELIETFQRIISDNAEGTPDTKDDVSATSPGSTNFSTGDLKIDSLVVNAAARYQLDPNLIFAVMRQESSFNPRAVSYKGARGLMQLMPATAARLGVKDIFDPAQNIDGGARYLKFLLDTFDGDVQLALAGYNAGEGAVARYGNRVPPYRETVNYVQRISAHYDRLRGGTEFRTTSRQQGAAVASAGAIELVKGTRTLSQY